MNRFHLSSAFVLGAAALTFTACSNKEDADTKPEYTATAGPTEGANITAPQLNKTYTTDSGLQYEALRLGTGKRPTKFSRVKVHYHGYLPNGQVFDSSVDRGEPIVFGLSDVIPGWTEGVQLMREGAKYRFQIPGYLAYGPKGSPPKIGPNQTLLFDIELFEVQ